MTGRRIQMAVSVRGRFDGVAYRASLARQAVKWGLVGFVRAQDAELIEAVFQGPQPAVDAMIAWCERGPLSSIVVRVEVSRRPLEAFSGFDLRLLGETPPP